MNLLEARQSLIALIGETQGDPSLEIKLNYWINRARHQFVAYGPWHFLMKAGAVDLVDGQMEYDLAGDCVHINDREVWWGAREVRLDFLTDQDFGLCVSNPRATGDILQWFRLTGTRKLQLYPSPTAAACAAYPTVRYEYAYRFTTTLVADTDDLGLVGEGEAAMLDLAEMRAQLYAGNVNLAMFAYNSARELMQQMWVQNSEILRLAPRDIPPAQKTGFFQQATEVNKS